jgi:hypothetical protein
MINAITPQRAIMATATPTPMPADASALNSPLAPLLELLGPLLGDDAGDERAAEEELVAVEELVLALVVGDVVEATTTAWPKFHPLIWTPTTDPPFEPMVVEVVNHGPVSVVIVR